MLPPYVPKIDAPLLAERIATCQTRDCRTPHAEITRPADERTLHVFGYDGLIKRRRFNGLVAAAPPVMH